MNSWELTSENVLRWGADWAIRSTILLAVAAGAWAILQRRSATVRHAVLAVAILGVMALPLMAWIAPGVFVVPRLQAGASDLKMEFSISDDETLGSDAASLTPNSSTEHATSVSTPSPPNSDPIAAVEPASDAAPVTGLPVDSSMGAPLSVDWPWRFATLTLSVWVVGILIGVLPIVVGLFSVSRLRRRARPFCRELQQELETLVRASGIGRRVKGLLSETHCTPMTWGICCPIVLLPEDSQKWTAQRRRMVLLHELAHIQRFDCFVQTLAQVVRALHWFNPLVWWSVRQLRMEQEASCDDFVIQAGETADEYASELLALCARRPIANWHGAVALSMSRADRLERRISAILDEKRERETVSRPQAWLGFSLFVLLMSGIAAIRQSPAHELAGAPSSPQSSSNSKDGPDQQVKSDSQNDSKKEAEKVPAQQSGHSLNDVVKTIEELSAVPVTKATLNSAAIRGMLEALGDPHSTILTTDQLDAIRQQTSGQFAGIGAVLAVQGDAIVIVEALANSPARQAGLPANSVIVAVDGKSAASLPEVVRSVRGPAGTSVTLRIRLPDGKEQTLSIERGEVRLPPIRALSLHEPNSAQYWLDSANKIAYVQIPDFGERTAGELSRVLTRLKQEGMRGLVLDLRNSPGGLFSALLDVAQLFLSDSVVVEIREKQKSDRISHRTKPGAPCSDTPMAVLMNSNTASSAEILAAALVDNRRAILVGDRTFGKGSVQSVVSLDERTALKITTAQLIRANGKAIDRLNSGLEWGVDPSDGFYVYMTMPQQTASAARRRQLGLGELPIAKIDGPDAAEQLLGDPQLAAAWRAMLGKLANGEFVPAGRPLSELRAKIAKSEERRHQRNQLFDKLRREADTAFTTEAAAEKRREIDSLLEKLLLLDQDNE